MPGTFLELTDLPSERTVAQSTTLGIICRLLAANPQHWAYPLGQHIEEVVLPAITHQMYRVLFDRRGNAVAYIAWARIAADAEKRFLATGKWQLHISEWNEGPTLWVVDIAAPYGHYSELIVKVLDENFSEDSSARFARVRSGLLVVSEITREGALAIAHRGRRMLAGD